MSMSKVTFFNDHFTGVGYWRAHVWNAAGYSSKVCLTHAEAVSWMPRAKLRS